VTLVLRTVADAAAAAPTVRGHLDAGGLIAYPTETVYGLGSAPTVASLDALSALKGRPPRKPFLLLVSSLAMVEEVGLVMTTSARIMAREFWPGPLTLVLRGGEGRLPDRLRGPEGGIAVRWTGLAPLAALIAAMGTPITSTSANRPGERTAPGIEAIEATFAEAVADGSLLLLDGGVLGNVPPSTLVDCTTPVPRLIRDGAIPRAELRRRAGTGAP
jgi:L-threonylcarbamoyladenylate synthase